MFQPLGLTLLVTVIVFLIGAFSAAYFRAFPHSSVRQQLTLIAEDRIGWTTQAILFPLAFLATAIIFGGMTFHLSEAWSRLLGILATILFTAGFLLWIPLSVQRLQYWSKAVKLLRNYNESEPVDVNFGGKTFWPHTYCILAGVGLMGAALALGGVLPTLGWIIAGLVVLVVGVAIPRWHDWPPFVSYIFLLIMAIGLMR